MYMRHNHSHRPSVKNSLHETVPALVRHAHKRRDASRHRGDAQLTGIANGEGRMLKIDEEAVIAT